MRVSVTETQLIPAIEGGLHILRIQGLGAGDVHGEG